MNWAECIAALGFMVFAAFMAVVLLLPLGLGLNSESLREPIKAWKGKK